MKLMTPPTNNPKVAKGAAAGFWTAILHLAPADLAGRGTVCPWSTAGCRAACLNLAGRGGIMKAGETSNGIQAARIRRTRYFFDDRAGFLADLERDIAAHVRASRRAGFKPAVRLNGTSDIAWERIAPDMLRRWIAEGVAFYDYTKSKARAIAAARARAWADLPARDKADPARSMPDAWPVGYDLTFSWSGDNAADCADVLTAGGRVAVPFAPKVPTGTGEGAPVFCIGTGAWEVIDGDASDLRFLDPVGTVVGLKAKGPAKRDRSGFVVALK